MELERFIHLMLVFHLIRCVDWEAWFDVTWHDTSLIHSGTITDETHEIFDIIFSQLTHAHSGPIFLRESRSCPVCTDQVPVSVPPYTAPAPAPTHAAIVSRYSIAR